jgi:hypothetical protein
MSSLSTAKMNDFFTSNREYNFIILLPLLNVLATVLTPYFTGPINPGILRTLLIGGFSIYFFFKRFVWHNLALKWAMYFLLYLGIMGLFSSSYSTTYNVFFKIYISTFLFVIGYYYSHIPGMFQRWNKMILISMIVFLLDFMVANAFGLGETGYKGSSEDTFFGGGGVNLAKNISVILLMSPIIYQELIADRSVNRRWIWIFYVAVFFGIIFLGLALKRGAILGFALGGLTFLILAPNRLRNFKNILVGFFVLLALSPFYWNRVMENLEIRSESIHLESDENLEKQGRYLEYQFVMDQWENADLSQQIFGANLFNEREHYSINRMFHTDYMSLLSGAGLLGLVIFIFTYFSILKELYSKVMNHPSVLNKRNWAIGAAIIVAVAVNGFSGTITSIEPRGMVMLYLGSLIGYASPKQKQ